jgi:hypothetical protein
MPIAVAPTMTIFSSNVPGGSRPARMSAAE